MNILVAQSSAFGGKSTNENTKVSYNVQTTEYTEKILQMYRRLTVDEIKQTTEIKTVIC